jgi:hypothetical protein
MLCESLSFDQTPEIVANAGLVREGHAVQLVESVRVKKGRLRQFETFVAITKSELDDEIKMFVLMRAGRSYGRQQLPPKIW